MRRSALLYQTGVVGHFGDSLYRSLSPRRIAPETHRSPPPAARIPADCRAASRLCAATTEIYLFDLGKYLWVRPYPFFSTQVQHMAPTDL